MIIGVVGKANVGKSTFFKSATLADVEIANYPFATIKPNSGVGYIRVECIDKEFNAQCNPREGFCKRGTRFVPVQLIDVAGLVPGAHEGKGMGNQFLDDIRQADVLIHVIDVSGGTNENGEPIGPGKYDPANDVRFLEVEIDLWFLSILKKGWEKFARQVLQEKREIAPALAKQLSGLNITEEHIVSAMKTLKLNPERPQDWGEDGLRALAGELRRLTKPMIIACNKIDIPGAEDNFQRLGKEFPDHLFVRCSSESELALREAAKHGLIDYLPGDKGFEITAGDKLNDRQKAGLGFIRMNMLERYGGTGVQDVLDRSVFELLGYMAIFPGGVNKLSDQYGNILPDCFLMPKGTTALGFAFRIHTDLGQKFIRAIDVRRRMAIGKDHPLKHRDIVEIVADR